MAADRQPATKAQMNEILIVEDCKDIQLLLARLLQNAGYSVTCASNGFEALELLQAADDTPAVILLDLMMPKMDGYQFRIEQEKDPRLASIPILAMTAYSDVQTKAMSIGAKGFLKKPFSDIETILAAVGQFFP